MRGKRRLIAAVSVAILCIPGTFAREQVSWDPPAEIKLEQVQKASSTDTHGWSVGGVWQYSGDSLLFGGFSALVALPDNRLIAFSDRGGRMTLREPDQPNPYRAVVRHRLAPGNERSLFDIEAATRDAAAGAFWIALENEHAVHRFDAEFAPTGSLDLDENALGWTNNTGAESIERLADGRFVIMPEGRRTGLIFQGDPIATPEYETFPYLSDRKSVV